jgi:NADPH-dependent ferric siderophore reductase
MTSPRKRPDRPAHLATVTATERTAPEMVRVHLDCPVVRDADAFPLECTDHYVKLLFPPEGASWSWDDEDADAGLPGRVRENLPRDEWPVMRTYTLRSWDREAGTLIIDFVAHGDSGLAGPWAAGVAPGARIGFMGPGGAWRPESGYDRLVLAGDEAAAPAIFAGLEALPYGTPATAYIEVADAESRLPLPVRAEDDDVTVVWVERGGATHGTELVRAVTEAGIPAGRTQWFIHGVAEMIRDLRRFLFVEGGVPKEDVSISGYWRLGMVEDEWQASKREFNQENEAAEAAATSAAQQ